MDKGHQRLAPPPKRLRRTREGGWRVGDLLRGASLAKRRFNDRSKEFSFGQQPVEL